MTHQTSGPAIFRAPAYGGALYGVRKRVLYYLHMNTLAVPAVSADN